jgi:hypothetical protein
MSKAIQDGEKTSEESDSSEDWAFILTSCRVSHKLGHKGRDKTMYCSLRIIINSLQWLEYKKVLQLKGKNKTVYYIAIVQMKSRKRENSYISQQILLF